MDKKEKRLFYLEYTILFFAIAAVAVYYFYSQGRSMIAYGSDGFRQHFRALLYYSNILKEMFGNFLHGRFIIPQWDFVIGEGADILNTFHYYAIGDIFTFFSFLCPEKYMYLYYDAATLARMYCSGLAFSCLCIYKKKDNRYALLVGTLLYAFCAFSLTSMAGHVFFISAAVYLPMIIHGVEKVIDNDKPYLLIISVALSSLSSIYFFYMNVLSTVIYAIIRVLFIHCRISDKVMTLIRIGLYSLIGVMIGSIVFVPMLKTMMGSSRMESEVSYGLLFSLKDYIDYFRRMTFGGVYFGGFSILWPIAFVYLFNKKKSPLLICLLVASLLFLTVPALSSAYNAFTYPIDRWCYAISLLVCYIITDCLCDIRKIDDSFIFNLIVIVIYYGICLFVNKDIWQIHAMLLVLSIVYVLFIRFIQNIRLDHIFSVVMVVFMLVVQMVYEFGPSYWGYAKYGTKIDSIEESLSGEYSVFNEIKDDDFFRYSGFKLVENAGVQGNVSSTQYYWSVVNSYITDYRKDLAYSDTSLHHFRNYGERFAQNALSSVRYYIDSNGDKYIPYGFEFMKNVDGYDVYKSSYDLPLVFAYDNYILYDEWKDLDPVKKNEILLQAGVIEKDLADIDKREPVYEHKELEYQMSHNDNIEITADRINVLNDEAYVYLNVNSDMAGEYYVVIEGLYSNKVTAYIRMLYEDIEKLFIFKGSDNQHYTDRHDYIVNLGYLEGIDGKIRMDFSDGGDYTYEKIRVICQPLERQIEYLDVLKDIRIDELKVKKNKVSTKISIDDDKLVCFSIPYSKGWKAYVDGKKADLLNCDIQYMALDLNKGEHVIELKYSTPLLKEAALISLSGMIVLAYLFIRDKKTRKE